MKNIRTKMGEGGRVIIPALIRHNLHLTIGDDIIIHVENDKIYLTTPDLSLKKLQETFKACSGANKTSLTDELIAGRRLEAENE